MGDSIFEEVYRAKQLRFFCFWFDLSSLYKFFLPFLLNVDKNIPKSTYVLKLWARKHFKLKKIQK